MDPNEKVLWEAEFNPKVKMYWLLSGAIVLTICVITIPLLPVWLILGNFVTQKYLDQMSCTLTDRAVRIRKGFFVRVEKAAPLDKLTDVGTVQGPIMRAMDLTGLSFETAGQSSQGALISMVGIVDPEGFREAVLEQRDKRAARGDSGRTAAASSTGAPGGEEVVGLLRDIRDGLSRIESKLDQ